MRRFRRLRKAFKSRRSAKVDDIKTLRSHAKVHGFIVHGLGKHDDEGYADAFVQKIRRAVESSFALPPGTSTTVVDFTAVSWSPLYEDSRRLYRAHYLDVHPVLEDAAVAMAELGFHLIGYPGRKDAILGLLAGKIAEVARQSPAIPIVLIGHSWGSVILYDFLLDLFENGDKLPAGVRDQIPPDLAKQLRSQIRVFISMGSPLGMVLASHGRPPEVLEKVARRLLVWENYRLQLDPIGHPLRHPSVVDVPGKMRDPLKNHFAYWNSTRVTEGIARWFVTLLAEAA